MKLNLIKNKINILALLSFFAIGYSSFILSNDSKPEKIEIIDSSLTLEENKIIISLQKLIDIQKYPNKTFLEFAEEVQTTLKSNEELSKKYNLAIKALEETKNEIKNPNKKPNIMRIANRFIHLKDLLPKPVEVYFKKYLQSKKLLTIVKGKESFSHKIGAIALKRLKAKKIKK